MAAWWCAIAGACPNVRVQGDRTPGEVAGRHGVRVTLAGLFDDQAGG